MLSPCIEIRILKFVQILFWTYFYFSLIYDIHVYLIYQCKRIFALPKMCSDCFVNDFFHLTVYNDHLSVSVNTDLHMTFSGYMLFHYLDIP